jgi:hypothetical protein
MKVFIQMNSGGLRNESEIFEDGKSIQVETHFFTPLVGGGGKRSFDLTG